MAQFGNKLVMIGPPGAYGPRRMLGQREFIRRTEMATLAGPY